jgi:hypothetical protein
MGRFNVDSELSISQNMKLRDEINRNEITNCKHDSSYFISKFVKVEQEWGPGDVLTDSPQEELLDMMETEQLVVGRYPRVFGKTTLLAGFALHKALFWEKTILYGSFNNVRRMDFLRQISYMYRCLPTWMTPAIHHEGPDGFVVGKGGIFPVSNKAWDLSGKKFDYLMIDEVGTNTEIRVSEFANVTKLCNARFSIVGTFKPDNPIVGDIWSAARVKKNGWASLPSFATENEVENMLSLVNPIYGRDY